MCTQYFHVFVPTGRRAVTTTIVQVFITGIIVLCKKKVGDVLDIELEFLVL
jgi:hypothetical protein